MTHTQLASIRTRSRPLHRVGAAFALVTSPAAAAAFAAAPPRGEDLSAWLHANLPQRGYITAVFYDESLDKTALYGFDIESQAFYACSMGWVSVRQADGRQFRSPSPYARVEPWDHESPVGESVEKVFPSVILYDIAARAASAESIAQEPDGGWSVAFSFYMGNRAMGEDRFGGGFRPPLKQVIYHISSEARLTEIQHETSAVQMEYADVDALLPVSRHLGANRQWSLLSVESHPRTDGEAFRLAGVLESATEAGVLDNTTRWRSPASPDAPEGPIAETSDHPRDQNHSGPASVPTMPTADGPRRLSVPLVAAGLVFVVAGIYAWVRRR